MVFMRLDHSHCLLFQFQLILLELCAEGFCHREQTIYILVVVHNILYATDLKSVILHAFFSSVVVASAVSGYVEYYATEFQFKHNNMALAVLMGRQQWSTTFELQCPILFVVEFAIHNILMRVWVCLVRVANRWKESTKNTNRLQKQFETFNIFRKQ